MSFYLEDFKTVIEKIRKRYPVPSSVDITSPEFSNPVWGPRSRNFYSILWVLATHGKCTTEEIAKHDGRSQIYLRLHGRRNTYSRILRGNDSDMKGLVGNISSPFSAFDKHGKRVDEDYKGKSDLRFGLSLLGVLLAVRLFSKPEFSTGFDPFGTLKPDPRKNNKFFDFRGQSKYPKTIIDDIAENYADSIPLVFGKWEYLKSHRNLNAFAICMIFDRGFDDHIELISRASQGLHMRDLQIPANEIALCFYLVHFQVVPYPLKALLSSIDKDARRLIGKLIHGYVNDAKRKYYHVLFKKSLFDGNYGKARKYSSMEIDMDERLSDEQKKRAKEHFDADLSVGIGIGFN